MSTIWHSLETAPRDKTIKLLSRTEDGGLIEERGQWDEVEPGFYVWRDRPFPVEVHPIAWRPAPNKLRIILACVVAVCGAGALLLYAIE